MSTAPSLTRYAIPLVLAYALVYIAVLGIRPLAELDEYRYAEVAREVLASGNWVSPTLDGVRYFEKPMLGHWLEALSLKAFGETSFAARLPSALATGLTALMICVFMRRVTGRSLPAALAAFTYLTSLATWEIGTLNILDPLLTLFLTATIAAYYLAFTASRPRIRRAFLATAGIACGLAFLTKGFLALVIPAIVIASFLVMQRQWRRLLSDAWLPLLLAACVAIPWALLVNHREPDFWRYFFWEEHINRFFGEADAQHSRPAWYFLATLPALTFPWIIAAPAAIAGLRSGGVDRRLVVFLGLWFAMPFLFFSISSGKLLTYVLPCFPAAAMLLSLGLDRYMAGEHAASFRRTTAVVAALFGGAFVYLTVNHFGIAGRALFGPTELMRWLLALTALCWGLLLATAAAFPNAGARRPWLLGASMLGLFVLAPFAVPDSIRTSKMPGDFIQAQKIASEPDAIVIGHGSLIHSISWSFQRNDIYVLDPGELRYGLTYADAAHRLVDPPAIGRLIAGNDGEHDILIITLASTIASLEPYLPDDTHRAQYGSVVALKVPGRHSVAARVADAQPSS